MSMQEILDDLLAAGLGSMPGGGAEIFHPEVRDQICEHKADAQNWLDIHRTAHGWACAPTPPCCTATSRTLPPDRPLDPPARAAGSNGRVQTFIPLAFHPDNTGLSHISKPSSVMDLRTMAVSRLMLDNVDHIKAYWIMLGIGTAQTALSYGADDLDGTVRHELIYHDAGAKTPEVLTVDEIRRLITEAGREPVERDTLYHRIERADGKWKSAEAITAAR